MMICLAVFKKILINNIFLIYFCFQIWCHQWWIFVIKGNNFIWNKICKNIRQSSDNNNDLLKDISVRKWKIPINVIKCFGNCIFIGAFVVPDQTVIWSRIFFYKTGIALNNLMIIINMPGKLNTTIDCQVRLISKSEMLDNAR